MANDILQVADDYWNIRGSFRIAGLIDGLYLRGAILGSRDPDDGAVTHALAALDSEIRRFSQ